MDGPLLYGRLPLANQTASTLDLSDLFLTMPLHSEDNEEQPNNGHQNRKHESFRRQETKHDSSKNIVFMEERKIWIKEYDESAINFASCKFVKAIGSSVVHPKAEAVMKIHDEFSRADRDLKIA